MVEPELTPQLALALIVLMAASLTACVWVATRLAKLGYLLPYEPRRRTPWGPLAGWLAVAMTVMVILTAWTARGDAAPVEGGRNENFTVGVLQMGAIHLGFAAAIVAVLVVFFRATPHDLGLPATGRQLREDVGLGVGIGLASLVPIYLIQLVVVNLMGNYDAHPLIEAVQRDPSKYLVLAVYFSAVISAPIFEELVYRLLLQGGLERWEDEFIDWPYSRRRLVTEEPSPGTDAMQHDESAGESPPATPHRTAPGAEHVQEHLFQEEQIAPALLCASGAVIGLRHGWAPILASSFLFALAHLGAGASPIALFVFALFLGYVYQRTHRILPSVVAHLVMNFISVSMMVLMV